MCQRILGADFMRSRTAGDATTGLPADGEKPWKRRMAQSHGLPGDMIGDMAEDMSKRRSLIP